MASFDKIIKIAQTLKNADELLQILELFIDEFQIESYENLKLLLKCVDNKIRVFIFDLLKKHNKLNSIVVETCTTEEMIKKYFNIELKSEESEKTVQVGQLLELEDSGVTPILIADIYCDIFRKLISDNTLMCTNVVKFAIYADRCPQLIFELLIKISKNGEIRDIDKRFVIGDCKQYIKKIINKYGADTISHIFSKIFWEVFYYRRICEVFGITEDIYIKYINTIEFDNACLIVLGLTQNLKTMNVNECRIDNSLINDNYYFVEITKKNEMTVTIVIYMQTLNKPKTKVFDRKLSITRGLLITVDDINNQSENKTYHLK